MNKTVNARAFETYVEQMGTERGRLVMSIAAHGTTAPLPDVADVMKTAAAARLFRYLNKLTRQGRQVPHELTDKLAKRTASTAQRQFNHLDQRTPLRQTPDWASHWGRAGVTYKDLGRNWDTVQSLSKELPASLDHFRKTTQDAMRRTWWQRLQQGRTDAAKVQQSHNELLARTLQSQATLRNIGRTIGQSQGTIAPVPNPVQYTPPIRTAPLDLTQDYFGRGMPEVFPRQTPFADPMATQIWTRAQ